MLPDVLTDTCRQIHHIAAASGTDLHWFIRDGREVVFLVHPPSQPFYPSDMTGPSFYQETAEIVIDAHEIRLFAPTDLLLRIYQEAAALGC